jgi:hypothetical protein
LLLRKLAACRLEATLGVEAGALRSGAVCFFAAAGEVCGGSIGGDAKIDAKWRMVVDGLEVRRLIIRRERVVVEMGRSMMTMGVYSLWKD